MKNLKNPIIFICSTIIALNVFATSALALNTAEITPVNDEISVRGEQKEWVYRNHNGVIQKRLWSRTYARWLTDWIDVK